MHREPRVEFSPFRVRDGRRVRFLSGIAGLALLSLLVAGCGDSAPKSHISAYAMAHPLIVQNPKGPPDAFYQPNPIRVRVGTRITWTNKDTDPHDVTAESGVFDSGPIGAEGTFSWIPLHPGTYPYFCTIHPEMHGVIVVSR